MLMQTPSTAVVFFAIAAPALAAQFGRVTQGALLVRDPAGRSLECPLKRTAVKVSITGPRACHGHAGVQK